MPKLSGIEPASGEDESGDDESRIESGSGAGMLRFFFFFFFDKSYFLWLGWSRFLELDLAVIYTLKKHWKNQISKNKSTIYLKVPMK